MASTGFCPFCAIAEGKIPSYKVYEDNDVMAILDIMPVRRGHLLIIPKQHTARVTELTEETAGALGKAVSKVSNALTKALENTRLNILCNQEYMQSVPHVHYHVIPAPLEGTGLPVGEITGEVKTKLFDTVLQQELGSRGGLEPGDATALVESIKAKL